MRPSFPFNAIIGQVQLKTALLLICVDPKIGGLLISGPRGSAKSTLVRSLTGLRQNIPFVTLPLGATEEMITGTFDLERALENAEVAFRPGLMAKADGGVLYVDEVNLLADHLVDLLLDAAASGTNTVERDGISHEHDSRFVLTGTMNPDEGELRPQLMDRFGIMARVQTEFSLDERKQVIENRLQYDLDPESFCTSLLAETEKIKSDLEYAITGLGQVIIPESIADEIVRRCADAQVEGMRADITMHRAASAHAALHQHQEVLISDIDVVEPLVLNHRRNNHPPERQQRESNGSGHSGSSDGSSTRSAGGSSIQGSWGAADRLTTTSSLDQQFSAHNDGWPNNPKHVRHFLANSRRSGGADTVKYTSAQTRGKRTIDWRRTLAENSGFRSQEYRARRDALQYRHAVPGLVYLDLVLLDTSASTLSGKGLHRAKGVVESLSKAGYQYRRHLGIITFGNNEVHTLLQPQRAPKNIRPVLDGILAGGGTPFTKALDYADCLLNRQQSKPFVCHVYIITDGRISDPAINHPLLRKFPVNLIDVESGRVKLGLVKKLATHIGANYQQLSATH